MGATRGVLSPTPRSPARTRSRRSASLPRPSRTRSRPRPRGRRHLRRGRRHRAGGRRGAAGRALPVAMPRRSSRPAGGPSASAASPRPGYDVLEAPMPALIVVHAGARRAALPVAQGDHGRPLEGDRVEGARRPRRRRVDSARWRGRRRGRRQLRHRPRAGRRRSSRARGRGRDARSPTSSPTGGSSDGRHPGSSARSPTARSRSCRTEVATLARTLADAGGGRRRRGSSSRPDPAAAATELARTFTGASRSPPSARRIVGRVVAAAAHRHRASPPTAKTPTWILTGGDARRPRRRGHPRGAPRLAGPRERDRRERADGRPRGRDERLRRQAGHARAPSPGTRHRDRAPERRHGRAGRERR